MDAVNKIKNNTNEPTPSSSKNRPSNKEIKKADQYGKAKIPIAAAASQNKVELHIEDPYQKHYEKYKVGLSRLDEPSKVLVKREIRIQVKTKADAIERRRRKKPGYKKPKIAPSSNLPKTTSKSLHTPEKLSLTKIERIETPSTISSTESNSLSSFREAEIPSELISLKVSIKPIPQQIKGPQSSEKSITKQIEQIGVRSFSAIKDVFSRLSQPFHKRVIQIHSDG